MARSTLGTLPGPLLGSSLHLGLWLSPLRGGMGNAWPPRGLLTAPCSATWKCMGRKVTGNHLCPQLLTHSR